MNLSHYPIVKLVKEIIRLIVAGVFATAETVFFFDELRIVQRLRRHRS